MLKFDKHDPTRLTVDELVAGDFVMIEVSDTGTGMTSDVSERAMDPFFTTKDVGSGTGLGLSMVYGFVEQSGGSVEIESRSGEGTQVKMYLPRAFAEAVELEVSTPNSSLLEETPRSAGFPRTSSNILIVEDDTMVRLAVAQMLHDLGCHTIEAEDGEVELELLADHPEIDLLFTDIDLPKGISGIDIAHEARRQFSGLKVLLSSGYLKKGVKGKLPEGDNFWFLEKPYRADELSKIIAEILKKLECFRPFDRRFLLLPYKPLASSVQYRTIERVINS